MEKVVIIGGGVSGLAAAYRLQTDHGIEPILLEQSRRAGGKAQTFQSSGFTCEEATNGWLDKEQSMRDLITELGLDARIQPSHERAARRFIYRAGSLREIEMHPAKFMLSSALPITSKLRLALEPFIPKSDRDDDETVADFAVRRLGRGALDLLISPMQSGIFAGDATKLSLKSCFGKIYDLEKEHGSLIKGMVALKKEKKAAGGDPAEIQAGPSGRLTSLKGGIVELVTALSRALGDRTRVASEVMAVRRLEGGGFEIKISGQERLRSEVVLSAAPAWAAGSFLKTLDEDGAKACQDINYPSLDVVCLGYRRYQVSHSLDGFGFLVPRNQGKTILGSLWTSSIFPGRAPDDHVLFRTMIGGTLEPQVAGWTEEQVIDTACEDLRNIIGIGKDESPSFVKVFRHRRAIPQYNVGHEKLIERIRLMEKRNPGFFFGGNAEGGIGVIDCVRKSAGLANRVAEFCRK